MRAGARIAEILRFKIQLKVKIDFKPICRLETKCFGTQLAKTVPGCSFGNLW